MANRDVLRLLLAANEGMSWPIPSAVVESLEAEITAEFPAYASWPLAAQDAMVDVVFSLGITKVKILLPMFWVALRWQRWDVCADECRRPDASEVRNFHTRKMFLEASQIHA